MRKRSEAYKEYKKEYDTKFYRENRQKCLDYSLARRKERQEKIHKITLHYKCCNPECKWIGEFSTSQLQLHHLDPSQKEFVVSAHLTGSTKRLAAEVNKCVVLCANCHALAHHAGIPINENMLCKVDENLMIIEAQ